VKVWTAQFMMCSIHMFITTLCSIRTGQWILSILWYFQYFAMLLFLLYTAVCWLNFSISCVTKQKYQESMIYSHQELVHCMTHSEVKTADSNHVHSMVEYLAQRNSEFQVVLYNEHKRSALDATSAPKPLSPAIWYHITYNTILVCTSRACEN